MLDSNILSQIAPVASPLPLAPTDDPLTAQQWATFIAICEVFLPSIPKPQHAADWKEYEVAKADIQPYIQPGTSSEAIDQFMAEGFDKVRLQEGLRRKVAMHLPKGVVQDISTVLSALNTKAGAFLLTGSTTPLQDLGMSKRTEIVCGWSVSYLKPIRGLFRSMQILSKAAWLAQAKILHEITGFPVVPSHVERRDGFNFAFNTFETTDATKPVELEYDIVIIGSGCGAGVMASHMGRAATKMQKKLRIVVLEKNYHFPTSHFPMNVEASGEHLMEGGGGILTDDGSVIILAGSTWGGGGTVNWSASLQPQHFVRREWAQKDGLDFFETVEFQDCLDTVCHRMGVCKMTDEEGKATIPHNFGNTKLIEGSRKLGLSVETVPQNTASRAHECGYCGEGCAGATKQGPANCWLPDAAEHGVEFIEGCFADEVIWDESTGSKIAVGLKAEWTSRDRLSKRKLRIKTKRIIASGGTLHSPALLLRSGIVNRNVGANLHLHPTMGIGMVWKERAQPWDGPILTAAMTSFENHDGQGHGPKIEMMTGTPGWIMLWNQWLAQITRTAIKSGEVRQTPNAIYNSALDYKRQIAKYAHTTGFIAIQRDKDTGNVYLDPYDPLRRQIRIKYTISQADAKGVTEGVIASARIAYAEGVQEIRPYSSDIPAFIRSSTASDAINDAAFKIWLDEVRTIGFGTEAAQIGSAHQMGTCRMSRNKDEGVVDSRGRVWGTKGLYVADASVFPSASGVNPMVTTMGISEWIARGIVEELGKE